MDGCSCPECGPGSELERASIAGEKKKHRANLRAKRASDREQARDDDKARVGDPRLKKISRRDCYKIIIDEIRNACLVNPSYERFLDRINAFPAPSKASERDFDSLFKSVLFGRPVVLEDFHSYLVRVPTVRGKVDLHQIADSGLKRS
jgi:hypothetical protein